MKKWVVGLLTGLALVSLAACQSSKKDTASSTTSSSTTAEKVTGETINFGVLPAESAIPIIIAEEKGFFKEEGTEVAIQPFSSPDDRNVALQSKALDGTISDVMTEATFKKNGLDLTITSGIMEDFKVLAAPSAGVTEMSQLAGKKVTLVPNFILEYIMDVFAEKDNFTYEIVNIPSFSARSEALMSGEVDAAVYTEPQASMLAQQGAVVLGDSKEAGIKGGAIQFTDSLLKERPQDVAAFYRGYNKAIDFMNENKASTYADLLTKYQFPDAMSTYLDSRSDAYPYAEAVSEDQFTKIIQWAKDKGQIDQLYTYHELTDFSFLSK